VDVMKAGIDVYSSAGTMESLGLINNRHWRIMNNRMIVNIHGFTVISYTSHHDAAEPLLYIVGHNGEYMLFATDTSHITQQWGIAFKIIAIECSYDAAILEKMVEIRDINQTLAERLLTSHMSKQNCMAYIDMYCDLSECEEIHLLHMSGDKIDKIATRNEFEKRFFIRTFCK
jgi:hypothetical protein